jgi:hypothetical protein
VPVIIKFAEAINKVPYFFVRGMKYMGTIFMDINPVLLSGETISCYMLPLIDDQTTFAMVFHNSSKRRPETSCPDYKEI